MYVFIIQSTSVQVGASQGRVMWRNCTPSCQINESTRLSFLDFPPTLYLDMSYVISPTLLVYLVLLILLFHPTPLFGPIFYEIYIEYPPYSFIWPYLFNWHLRVTYYAMKWNSTKDISCFERISLKVITQILFGLVCSKFDRN